MATLENFVGHAETAHESLKNYGFVCRNERSDQYYCIYKVSDNRYDEAFICESEISDLLDYNKSYLPKDTIDLFLGNRKITKENFMKVPPLVKIQSLINFFGTEEILGKSTQDLTLAQALRMVEEE